MIVAVGHMLWDSQGLWQTDDFPTEMLLTTNIIQKGN